MIFKDKNKYYSDFVSRIENKELKKMWDNDLHFKEKFFDYIYFYFTDCKHLPSYRKNLFWFQI